VLATHLAWPGVHAHPSVSIHTHVHRYTRTTKAHVSSADSADRCRLKRDSESHRDKLSIDVPSRSRRDARALEKPPGWIGHGKDRICSSRSGIKIFRVPGYEKAENLTFGRIPCLQDCEFNEREGE